MRRAGLAVAAGLLLISCGEDPTPRAAPPAATAVPGGAPATAVAGDPETGRRIYLANCVACHNADPSKPGPVGPAVKGSSPALLEARVLRAAYPEGYPPKRDSSVMSARPDLAPRIPDLAAYLR